MITSRMEPLIKWAKYSSLQLEIIFRINGDVATAKGILNKEIDLLEKAGTLGKDNEKAVIIDGKTMGLVFEDPDARDLFAQLGIR